MDNHYGSSYQPRNGVTSGYGNMVSSGFSY
jgi:hypothetical protein